MTTPPPPFGPTLPPLGHSSYVTRVTLLCETFQLINDDHFNLYSSNTGTSQIEQPDVRTFGLLSRRLHSISGTPGDVHKVRISLG